MGCQELAGLCPFLMWQQENQYQTSSILSEGLFLFMDFMLNPFLKTWRSVNSAKKDKPLYQYVLPQRRMGDFGEGKGFFDWRGVGFSLVPFQKLVLINALGCVYV